MTRWRELLQQSKRLFHAILADRKGAELTAFIKPLSDHSRRAGFHLPAQIAPSGVARRLEERQDVVVYLRTVANRIDIRLRGLQVAVDLHPAMRFCSGALRQRGFCPQAGGSHHRIYFNAAAAIQLNADTVSGFLQPLQLRFQQQLHAHIGQAML